MSILSKITTGRVGRAQKVVIYAPEGFGKSTIASQFPDPLFFDVEDSTSQLDVRRLSRAELPDLAVFESALAEVVKTKACATLAVDTADWLEQMAIAAIIADANSKKIQGIEDFRYGKGYTYLAEKMTLLLAAFDRAINAGIHVVLLAHAKVSKFEPPDGAGPFDRYEMKLSKHVAPLIKEWADMLLFGNWRLQVREKDKGESGQQFKGVGGKERLMHCTRVAAWDAKNRHGMKEDEPWSIDAIKKAFLSVGAPWGGGARPGEIVTPLHGGKILVERQPEQISQPAKEVGQHEVTSTSTPPEGATPPVRETATTNPTDPEVVELARICEPQESAINEYLIGARKVNPGQTFRDVSADYRKRVLKNPAGFLKIALNGKAVAA